MIKNSTLTEEQKADSHFHEQRVTEKYLRKKFRDSKKRQDRPDVSRRRRRKNREGDPDFKPHKSEKSASLDTDPVKSLIIKWLLREASFSIV